MKLWILKPTLKGYKRISEMAEDVVVLVRAETEDTARSVAQRFTKFKEVAIWTNSKLSTCDELTTLGDVGVVVEMIDHG